jgi:CysZ protein
MVGIMETDSSREKGALPGRFRLFAYGLKGPFAAWRLVGEHGGLKRYFIIPFLINLVLLSGIVYLSYIFLYPLLQGIIPQGDAWYIEALKWLITPLLLIVLAIIIVLLYSISGSIITAPFNDPLSARVERLLTRVAYEEKFSVKMFFADIVRMTLNVAKLLLLLVIFYIVILFLNLIPVIGNIVYSILSLFGTTFFLGFQFFDFPLERRRMGFRDKLIVLWKQKFLTMGLGLGFFIISVIPILGFLGLNLGAIAGTVLYIEYIKPALDSAQERKG